MLVVKYCSLPTFYCLLTHVYPTFYCLLTHVYNNYCNVFVLCITFCKCNNSRDNNRFGQTTPIIMIHFRCRRISAAEQIGDAYWS